VHQLENILYKCTDNLYFEKTSKYAKFSFHHISLENELYLNGINFREWFIFCAFR